MLPQQLSYTVSGLYKLAYTEKTLIKKIADLVLALNWQPTDTASDCEQSVSGLAMFGATVAYRQAVPRMCESKARDLTIIAWRPTKCWPRFKPFSEELIASTLL